MRKLILTQIKTILNPSNENSKWYKTFAFDEFTQDIVWLQQPPINREIKFLDNIKSIDISYIRLYLETLDGIASDNDIMTAFKLAAYDNKINSLLDNITKEKWDNKSRLDTWLIDYLGAD